jgi:UDP-N-acetylmuramate dehydrogenase
MEILGNASLKSFNTFGVEATARFYIEARSRGEIIDFVKAYLPKLPPPFLVLGGGSNVLFTHDFEGTVIKVSSKGISLIEENEDHIIVKAEAGERWHEFVTYCVNQGWGGLENLSLIPGNVGSSPIQNIGAYGIEMKDRFHSLEALDIENNQTKCFSAEECSFGYRTSVFKNELKGKFIILSVTFKLLKNHIPDTSYGSISQELQSTGIKDAGIRDVAEAVIRIRQRKLPDPNVLGNAGSFFKNPVVTAFEYYRLKNEFPGIIGHNQYDGTFKLAAGWLIEQCGWKGFRRGDTGVHKDQSLIIVNYGSSSGKEILLLAGEIQESVKRKYKVTLEPEVNIF